MSYNQPNYAKKKSGSALDPVDVTAIVLAGLVVPIYEPVMAQSDIVLSTDGDILMVSSGYSAPLLPVS